MTTITDNNIYKSEALGLPGGMLVIWSLGNFCPYKCTYCNPYFNDGRDPYHSLEHINLTLAKIPNNSKVIFSGGEPTYHPDFEEILDNKPDTFSYGVISNGARPKSFWERVYKRMNPIILTFHSEFATLDRFVETALVCKPSMHRINLTMIPWMWDESVIAYETFIKAGLPVSPKPLVKDFGYTSSSLLSEYTPDQVAWIRDKNGESGGLNYVKLYDSSGKLIKHTNPSAMLSSGETNFRGWECHTPTKTLYITTEGGIYDTSCKQRRLLGTVSTGFELPTAPVICQQDFCWSHSDIEPLKIRV